LHQIFFLKHLFALNHFFLKYKFRLLGGILFIILSNYFRVLSPQVSGYIIDEVIHQLQAKTTSTTKKYDWLVNYFVQFTKSQELTVSSLIIYCGIILLLLAILGGFFMFLMRQTIIVMSRHIEYDQKNQLFAHYLKLDTSFYKVNATGDLMNRIAEDVSRVRMYTGPALMYIINLTGTIGFSLYFMFKENALLSIYVIAPLPLLAITIYYVNNLINKKSEQLQESLSNLTSNAQETYAGIRVIKSFVQEESQAHFFNEQTKIYQQNATNLAKVEAIYFPSIALLIGLSTIIAIAVGCYMHLQNPAIVTAGTIASFVIYVNMLTFPVSAIGLTASMIQRAAASQKRLNEFLAIQPSNDFEHQKPINALEPLQELQFKEVDFTYEHTGINAIHNLSTTINVGEKVLIIGKTGSGKTTLAQLLLKMFSHEKGAIYWNNQPINNIDTFSLRNKISYVPQDVFLFSDDIKNNILFGTETNQPKLTVEAAATKASIAKEIKEFELGFDTIVGERGVNLSGGQKQRISIARALLRPAYLYIFDDCLSAVDVKTEKNIALELGDFLQEKTAIFISHRVLASFSFSKILVLENGTIVEQGTHDELMQLNGYYAETYIAQTTTSQ
jgi:ATP-binding cassette, subfamily B, multidrug efflux pump